MAAAMRGGMMGGGMMGGGMGGMGGTLPGLPMQATLSDLSRDLANEAEGGLTMETGL